ncbi:uncharacterized protein LOC126839780 [Adelges cooleyi]|uniref:uncharacterized protein LOC126839780 n=1 Tax=Adelges cooleyi TaxID=133065 RepID=UPI00217F24CB|nr:uncharacterized protein LOC126839780 [Adelges cooleyi]
MSEEAEEAATETVTELIRRALECPVCLQLACRIRCCCFRGHTVCDLCFDRLLDLHEPTCPMCRSPISATRSTAAVETALANIVRGIKTSCSYRPLGCRQLVAIPDVNAHEASCPNAPDAKCYVSTCQWTGTHDQIYEHVSSDHPGSVVAVQSNRYTVPDVRALLLHRVGRHRAFLLKDARDNMMWVILCRGVRRTVRVHMMLVKTAARPADRTRATYRVSTGGDVADLCRGRRRVMLWDRNVAENSNEALASIRGLVVRQKQYNTSLTISWNIR